jgi:hypothetical protein
MAWQGGKLHGGQRKKPVILLILLFILATATAALGMSLYGAKMAHTKLWLRLQEQGMDALGFLCNFPLFFIIHHHITRRPDPPTDPSIFFPLPSEVKITKMQQSMAEVKVEAVDSLSKNNDLISERDYQKQQQQATSDTLREVRSFLSSK